MRFFIVFFIISSFLLAQEEKKDSPLVEAAKKTGKYKIQKGTKITNSLLKTSPSSPQPAEEVVIAGEGEKKEEAIETEYKDNKGRTKEDWQKIMQEARQNVTILENQIMELQSKLNRLTNDYYAWDDVAYREGVIKVEMDKTREEIEKAREELKKAKEKIPELEEEARKSGALPGWLR